ncbi:stage III sporulation protein SpoIIIAA [Deinococcus budaensis]|uniref:Stage III sporulation protein SpoIIIAA n=1 Tax=Deinococcus budaensis TaxID=1665626 RepID=A0A7W8GHZ9_9DEIO|nr:stage III sporulation protein SpoIIIAA [Deinococcus budaensis]
MKYPAIRAREDLELLEPFLPHDARELLGDDFERLDELRLLLEQPFCALFSGEEEYREYPLTITGAHMSLMLSVTEEAGGFRDDNRMGVEGTGHRISRIRQRGHTIGYTIRVGRYFDGIGLPLVPYLCEEPSMLIVGEAGSGKTTLLRGILRLIVTDPRLRKYRWRTVPVDTSGEMCGAGRIVHAALQGVVNMPVDAKSEQAKVILEATTNQNPRIIGVDEINKLAEAEEVADAMKYGARLIGSTHGRDLRLVHANKNLAPLFSPEPVFRWAALVRSRGVVEVYDMREALPVLKAGGQPTGKLLEV